jgi:hypothetical protein
MDPNPRLKDYYAGTLARPAWHRTLSPYSVRLNANVAAILDLQACGSSTQVLLLARC